MRFVTGLPMAVGALGLILAASAWAAEVSVDDFETYASDIELQAVCAAATANASTHVAVPGYSSAQCMKISYHNGQDPWWTNVIYTLASPQDWTGYARMTLRYKGEVGNSGETLIVQLKDEWGGWLDGASISNGTQAGDWTEYAIDISGWAGRSSVVSIEIHLPAQSYGAGNLYVDRISLDTFPPVIDSFEGYSSDAELQLVCAAATANASTHVAAPGRAGQCMRVAYHNGQDPWWTNVIYTLGAPQDWTDYAQLTFHFKGEPGNSGEALIVQLKDEWGNWLDGPTVDRATQAGDWTEYAMDISGWAERSAVTSIEFHLPAQDYGAGNLYIDQLELSDASPTSAEGTSWSEVKQMFR